MQFLEHVITQTHHLINAFAVFPARHACIHESLFNIQ